MILDHYSRTLHETLIAIIELHELVMICFMYRINVFRIIFHIFIAIHSVPNESNTQFMSRLFIFTTL